MPQSTHLSKPGQNQRGTPAEAGKALSEHPRIGSITFTGSVETGRAIIRASAEHVKPVVLELGGKSPQIVFADGDLDRAASEFDRGYFVSPTVFDCVSSEMSIAREEIFGPVLSVLVFSGDEEAANIANDSKYGLAAGVFTSDIDRAMRFARDIQAGYVMINECFTCGPGSPFGGYKQSGIGRERGLLALQNYTQVKNVVVRVRQCSPGPKGK